MGLVAEYAGQCTTGREIMAVRKIDPIINDKPGLVTLIIPDCD